MDFPYSEEEYAVRVDRDRRARELAFFNALLIDPMPTKLVRSIRKMSHPEMRGCLHEGSVYWWPAYIATHLDGWRYLGVEGRPLNAEVELHVDEHGIYLTAKGDEGLDAAHAHGTLLGAFDGDWRLKEQIRPKRIDVANRSGDAEIPSPNQGRGGVVYGSAPGVDLKVGS